MSRASSERGSPFDRLTLRFPDPQLERAFLDSYFDSVRGSIRTAHMLGIALWVLWRLVVRRFIVEDRAFDLRVRYLLLIPIALVGLASTYLPGWRRFFQVEAAAAILLTGVVWIVYTFALEEMAFDYGYVGLILIMTFSYTLLRMRFRWNLATSAALAVTYFAYAIHIDVDPDRLALAAFYLCSFLVLGAIASYTLERSNRLLFLRERELDRERARSESLLRNILPRAIIHRLKARHEDAEDVLIADALDQVTVVFVDLEGHRAGGAHTSRRPGVGP